MAWHVTMTFQTATNTRIWHVKHAKAVSTHQSTWKPVTPTLKAAKNTTMLPVQNANLPIIGQLTTLFVSLTFNSVRTTSTLHVPNATLPTICRLLASSAMPTLTIVKSTSILKTIVHFVWLTTSCRTLTRFATLRYSIVLSMLRQDCVAHVMQLIIWGQLDWVVILTFKTVTISILMRHVLNVWLLTTLLLTVWPATRMSLNVRNTLTQHAQNAILDFIHPPSAHHVSPTFPTAKNTSTLLVPCARPTTIDHQTTWHATTT